MDRKKGITAVSTVPTLAAMWDSQSLTAVRLLIFGGEACPPSLVEKLAAPSRELWNTYGPTETTVIACGQLMVPGEVVRIGLPIPGWKLAVVDSDGLPVNWGEIGELVIGGVGLGRYLDSKKDAEKFAPLAAVDWKRAYRTGDLVRADHEGLVFHGRADDQIKIGGRRLELGEVDAYLAEIPGVDAAAAAVHQTGSGNDVLVGYLSGVDTSVINLEFARAMVSAKMPKGIVPVLCIVDELPMKTSGKVDRAKLPWPISSSQEQSLPLRLRSLGKLWIEQLGPIPLNPESNFFELGGGSVAIARLTGRIRETHPTAEIAELYSHPTLDAMDDYLQGMSFIHQERKVPEKIPKLGGVWQSFFISFLYLINAVRFVVGALMAVWILETFFDAGWVPTIPLLPILIAWVLFYSLPGKSLLTAAIARPLTLGLSPGRYRRGGWTHLRIWAAQRTVTFMQLENLGGTPFAPMLHRLLGSRIGHGCHIAHNPSITGLISIDDGATIEFEADLDGYWIDGDEVIVGAISIGKNARIGTRTLVLPGVSVAENAEVIPGSTVNIDVAAGEMWGGSPLHYYGEAGKTWPDSAPIVHMIAPVSWLVYGAGLLVFRVLQLIAILPGLMLIFPMVGFMEFYEDVFPILAMWVPVFTVLMIVTWLAGVVVVIRAASLFIRPGYFPVRSGSGFAVWLTHTLLQRTLVSTFPIYASSFTPMWMRMLGARVGRNVEISTVETIPHLTWIKDRSFLADHSLVNSTRLRSGWMHVGTTVIGEGSFVGNSSIVGPDRDVPDASLVAVLSTVPFQPNAGSSWIGRYPRYIPRNHVDSENQLTFDPPIGLKTIRMLVEICRILPAMLSNWFDLLVVFVLTEIYMYYWLQGTSQLVALGIATIWSWPVLLVAGTVAALIPIAVKWLLIGRFQHRQVPLFSSYVWRGELIDVFVEGLAVPGMVRMSLGTPMLNLWHRLMGASIGRDVWCETWWLPEYDLVIIGNRATINRGTVLQTHLFHDRVMSMESVLLNPGSTLGVNSIILPGSVIGTCTTIGSGSLVQRQERIPDDSYWQGNPVRYQKETENTSI